MRAAILLFFLVFCRQLLAQELPQVLMPNSQINEEQFGRSMQFCQDKLLVGSSNIAPNALTGKVYIFEQNGATFKQTGQIELANSQEKRFGWQINANNTQTLISAYTENTTKPAAGAVYVYNNDDNRYKIQQKISL